MILETSRKRCERSRLVKFPHWVSGHGIQLQEVLCSRRHTRVREADLAAQEEETSSHSSSNSVAGVLLEPLQLDVLWGLHLLGNAPAGGGGGGGIPL